MKQKTRSIKALLLAFALIVSLVPVAFAGQNCPNCGMYINPTGWSQSYNSGSYHTQYCNYCRNTVSEAHQFVNGACITCGYGGYYGQYAHTHSFNGGYTCITCGYDVLTGQYGVNHTHNYNGGYICTICGYNSLTGQYGSSGHTHNYNGGYICITCGFNSLTGQYETSHTHNYNGGYICVTCGFNSLTGQYETSHTHNYNGGYICVTCGYNSLTGQYETSHTHNYNGGYICVTCGYNSLTGQYETSHTHNYNGGYICITCGYNSLTGQYGSNGTTGTVCSTTGCALPLTGTWVSDSQSSGYHYTTCALGHVNYGTHYYGSGNQCLYCGAIGSGTTTGTVCSTAGCALPLTGTWICHPQYPEYHYQSCASGHMNYGAHYTNGSGLCVYCGSTGVGSGALSLTISQASNIFSFTDASQTGYSVFDLLAQSIYSQSIYDLTNYSVTFTTYNSVAASLYGPGYSSGYSVTSKLSELGNVYLYIASSGTWTANYAITYGGSQISSGTLTITISPNTLADINYAASLGENVALSIADFQKFWQQNNVSSASGTLNYVRINSVSGFGGTLCYNHTANETSHTSASGNVFYLSPSAAAQQKDLSKLTFVPAKSGNKYNPGTVTINFTAYGTNRYNSQTSASGKVVITYTKTDVSKIEYNCTGSYINLNNADFTKVYKSAVSTAAATPNFTVKFLDVPVYGKLYSGYGAYGVTGTELTASNIGSFSFSNNSSASNSISKVAYIPGGTGMGDTVRYAVYSGSTLQYIGTVTFNTKEIVVNYGSSSSGVTFNGGDFYYGDASLSNAQYISFGTPSSGTLYKNYSNGKGTAVTKNDYFAYTASSGIGSLNSVTFVPKANFTGVVTIPFYAYNISGGYSTGTVKVYVVAKAFSDVSGWSASYINRLYASGVVGGTSATTFSPKANMKYGEALKMIMLAAGYPKQAETGGKHWASNYLSLAYTKRIVSSTNIDLNALVDRNTVAELAAKALGLDKATTIDSGVIAPIDSSNGYVYALYNAGIVGGEIINGSSYFYGNRNISREEVAKIICNIMDYEK